jgi:hypothetical protein
MNVRSAIDTLSRNLLAHSPRRYCESCKGVFLLGRLGVNPTNWKEARCPLCGANGPFREPTPEELAVAVPETRRQWPVAVLVGVSTVVFIAWIVWHG